jgi:hypothetical protein
VNTAERVFGFLRKHQGQTYCDTCLQKELRISKPISTMLDVLSLEYVKREIAECGVCGEERLSVMRFRS